jgi:glutaredoxin
MIKYFLASVFLGISFVLAGCGQDLKGVAPTKDNSAIIFFYGQECPHCKIVEQYLSDNKVSDKVQFSQREVYHDKANAALLTNKAAECGIKEDSLGVPFLWENGKCHIGQEEVIQFFKNKIGSNN